MTGRVDLTIQRRSNRRLALWAALVAPLLIYILVVPIRARLDQGVIERHRALEIWRVMVSELPSVGVQWLLELAFVAGLITVIFGSLLLIWLALDDSQAISARQATQPDPNHGHPDDEPAIPRTS